jgi:brefeldin A-resistance guanine nucleotide exchange factor 1
LQNSTRLPPTSGYGAAKHLIKGDDSVLKMLTNNTYKPRESTRTARVNRMKIAPEKLPTQEELKSVRTKKRLMNQSVDLFNSSPSKCIQFLKDNNIFSNDPDVYMKQLIKYLKETPALDKKMIGEYLSNRKHNAILEEFIKSFVFSNLRIDEALRLFLETFRLPGEAPLISTIMEHFARHWRNSNQNKFADDDAAFTLSYAIIMLNVDQHNHNVKKQSTPMVVEEFKKNLSRVNGGGNFDDELLEEIYVAIKTEEIVMPAEHKGALRDNYLWKVLIRRGLTSDANYIHAPAGSYNQEIFNIVWGQTISALSFVYDKSLELSVIQKTINGFRKCAQIAAHYMMSDVFDNIVISLCKFTALSSQADSVDQIAVNFGMNNKAQLACKTVFQLVRDHGDILRDGWKNILDCIIQLYKAKLLPKILIECEDYLNPKGRILLIKEEAPIIQKPEGSGLFSSFFPFMSSDLSSSKGPSQEELEATKNAQSCIEECHIEQLIHDTKFLRVDSLMELVKALVFASQSNEADMGNSSLNSSLGSPGSNVGSMSSGINSVGQASDAKLDHDAVVFSLEVLIKVVLQNRDRISCIWTTLRNHFYNIIINAPDYSFFLERTVVGLLRISARLLRREELANEVLSSLRMLLLFKKKSIIRKLSRQVAFGIHDLLRTNAVNIHSNDDWSNIFTILQVYGAGASIPLVVSQSQQFNIAHRPSIKSVKSEKTSSNENLSHLPTNETLSDRGYTSDSEIYQQLAQQEQTPPSVFNNSAVSDQTLNLNKSELFEATFRSSATTNLANQYKIDLDDEGLGQHDKKAFAKCCETLTFLIRDMAHVTLQNFESCIHCLRTFVEACVLGDRTKETKKETAKTKTSNVNSKSRLMTKSKSQQQALYDAQQSQLHKRSSSPKSDESDEDDQFITSYETISIQLLDLLDTLHLKAASIFTAWAEEQRRISQKIEIFDSMVSNLWSKCWCPILQGIARLSCDIDGEVRMHALQYLQRALLVHELQTLSAMEWEACFNKVKIFTFKVD